MSGFASFLEETLSTVNEIAQVAGSVAGVLGQLEGVGSQDLVVPFNPFGGGASTRTVDAPQVVSPQASLSFGGGLPFGLGGVELVLLLLVAAVVLFLFLR